MFSTNKAKFGFKSILAALLFVASSIAHALPIYVLNDTSSSHTMVQSAIGDLNSLGHSVTTGGTLADYSAYSQVWDLRYNANLGAADVTAMGSYLAGGGRMYMTGEHAGFNASRNTSLVSWVNGVGGGNMILADVFHAGLQTFTAAGSAVGLDSAPNALAGLNTNAANSAVAASIDQGFLVTQEGNLTQGSVVGWDFGDISGAAGSRMLLGFDIELFANGVNWTENMVAYLDSASAPEPGILALMGMGLLGIGFSRRKKAA